MNVDVMNFNMENIKMEGLIIKKENTIVDKDG